MTISQNSQTSLTKKLGIKPAMRILLVNQPEHYLSLLGDFPQGVIQDKHRNPGSIDWIHGFFHNQQELLQLIPTLRTLLKPSGQVWCSWQKQSSGLVTDLSREDVRRLVLTFDLVDIKVCSVDDTWSALKFVIPKALRYKNTFQVN